MSKRSCHNEYRHNAKKEFVGQKTQWRCRGSVVAVPSCAEVPLPRSCPVEQADLLLLVGGEDLAGQGQLPHGHPLLLLHLLLSLLLLCLSMGALSFNHKSEQEHKTIYLKTPTQIDTLLKMFYISKHCFAIHQSIYCTVLKKQGEGPGWKIDCCTCRQLSSRAPPPFCPSGAAGSCSRPRKTPQTKYHFKFNCSSRLL